MTRLTRHGEAQLSVDQQEQLKKAREHCETFNAHKATVMAQRKLFNQHVRMLQSAVCDTFLREKSFALEK